MISGNVNPTFNPKNHPSLGNNLFLISTTLAIAWENNVVATFPSLFNQCEYWKKNHENTIYRNLCMQNTKVSITYTSKVDIDCFFYEKISYIPDMELSGFFLSYKYFDHFRNDILKIFQIDDITKEYIENKYANILNNNSISIHVRRGDYKKSNEKTNGGSYRLDASYYENAITFINDKILDPIYFIFTEKEEDIYWCKKNIRHRFPNNKIIIITGEDDYIDMYIMSFCKNNIIANSTFSWWAAYLNHNKNKIVIYPKNWLDSEREQNFFLPDWIGIPI